MRTATLAKLALTASVGIGTLFSLAAPAQAQPPAQQGTIILDKAPPPTTSTTLVLQGEVVDPTPPKADLPLATPGDLDPTVHPTADPIPADDEDPDCQPIPGAADCPPEDCVPVSTQPDPWSHCDDPKCPDTGSTVPVPGTDCDDPECPETGPSAPRSQVPPTTVPEDCDDPECPDVVVLNASTRPTDDPGRPEDCDRPECPETEDRPVARIQGQERPRPEDCDRPECPETEDRPVARIQGQQLEEPQRPDDCDREEPCTPEPGEDESCRLPKTGAEMATYVAAGVGLTGAGAALKGLQRVLRRRRP